MKVTAQPSFKFNFEIPLEALEALAKVSARHYDSRCKEAGGENGFIGVWIRTIKNGFQDISGSANEFDVSLKIMEQAQWCAAAKIISREELDLLIRLMNFFSRLFSKSNELYMSSRTEFEAHF